MTESLEMGAETGVLDVRGLFCPAPIIRTRRRLDTLAAGATLDVLSDDPVTLEDLPAFCRSHGHDFLGSEAHPEGFWCLRIRKR